MRVIFPIIVMTCNAIFLIVVFRVVWNRIKTDLNIKDDQINRTAQTIDIFGNSIEQEKETVIERKFRRYDGLISVFTAFAFFGIVYSLILQDVYELIKKYQEHQNYTTPVFCIVVFLAGYSSARIILKNLSINSSNELFDTENNAILSQRSDRIVTWYLAFIFFALFFAFWSEFDLKYNIIKALILSFLLGNGFYYIFRQNYRISDFFHSSKKKRG